MGVLSGAEIKRYLNEKNLVIDPLPDPACFGAASVDLTLGNSFRSFIHHNGAVAISNSADAKDYQKFTETIQLNDGEPYFLGPNQMCLGITRERVQLPDTLCALVEGRSRFARLGLSVHITASLINPGVNNQTVLEIFNASSLTLALYPGTKICQMIFLTMDGHGQYSGSFQSQVL
ncbi:dCTP deaminase [Gonapodya prolifera JEL478]|uniref:dCTP deaminase n=1 Tax=Gonapodya prolifera (strain JEL478) TaxID=1344416 RepID=A0A139AVC3_GONPJ|nr:dCTP deaminase [Gonapodya prolifera JEL478]|eukprot:KXS20696.1 dCTP deaminase [Gonapodya prolifera JEL478]